MVANKNANVIDSRSQFKETTPPEIALLVFYPGFLRRGKIGTKVFFNMRGSILQ